MPARYASPAEASGGGNHLGLVGRHVAGVWVVCASYGLGGGPYPAEGEEPDFDLSPLDEKVPAQRLADWMAEQGNTAKITGARARNLNPLIISHGDHRRLEFAWWWLHLGNKPARFNAFNSRAETLTTKWKSGLKQRGLAPATWYVEKGHRFGLAGEAFGIAAITTTATQADGSQLLTYSIVTREAVGAAAEVHPRMPLIVPAELQGEWLHPGVTHISELVGEVIAASEHTSLQVELADPRTDTLL